MIVMAIFFFRTSIIRAGNGKSAVASAAYQAAQKIRSESLGISFSYTNKEEVIHSEVLLPPNAPKDYKNRETLWNAVEASQKSSNSRYARQFVIAVPNEWSREEAIERCRQYLQKAFVDQGMIADWALHDKRSEDLEGPNNLHIHVMCTVRSINPDGTWQQMEKKEYALDKDGNKIPEIDSKTGEQKVRRRVRNGHETTEKVWKRVSVVRNTWNSHEQLVSWKKMWAEHCNQYLAHDQYIDYRSYLQRGLNRLPQLHEGPDARAALARGDVLDVVKENQERKAINERLDALERTLNKIKSSFNIIKERILTRGGIRNDQTGSNTQSRYHRGVREAVERSSGVDEQHIRSDADGGIKPKKCRGEDKRTEWKNSDITEARQGISTVRKRLSDLIKRNRALAQRIGDSVEREREIEEYDNRVQGIKEQRRRLDDRSKQIRSVLLGDMGGAVNQSARGFADAGASTQSERTAAADTESFIREVRASVAHTRSAIADSTARRADRDAERERSRATNNNQEERRVQKRKRMG